MITGALYTPGNKCEFIVWAPFAKEVSVILTSQGARAEPMERDGRGYWRVELDDVEPGDLYLYSINGSISRPDPASFFQPQGVHRPSQVVDHSVYEWQDSDWRGVPLRDLIIYELHVGAFSPSGDFQGVAGKLDNLLDLGVNAIELMPVAQFPGDRNWGYDGVHPYAVQDSYGGPEGLKRLVDAAHGKGMAVVLDVVYNHLGPEGNYLSDFGPNFTDAYKTPWGTAVNFDGPYSDQVREFFIENALYFFREYHMDALRLDAVHGIYDRSAKHFLEELVERAEELSKSSGREFYLIAESDLNDVRVIRERDKGGYGVHAQWSDDFHHSLHALLTGERHGYYADFGDTGRLVKALNQGFVYSWDYSGYRKRRHGSSSEDRPGWQLLVCSQNHDQVGNRAFGERLSALVGFEALKLAAGAVLCSPYIPLLFMGEEHGEDNPFLYFVNHMDPDLVEAVRRGRKEEFKDFEWEREPPDPASEDTFERSRLDWSKRGRDKHARMLAFYKELIALRKSHPALARPDKKNARAWDRGKVVMCLRRNGDEEALCIMDFSDAGEEIGPDVPAGKWRKLLDSADAEWHGPGAILPQIMRSKDRARAGPYNFALYIKEART